MARGGEARPHSTKGAPEYDRPKFWDARFAEGLDVGEWLNSGEMVIATVMSELEGKSGYDGERRVLHLGPGVSRLGEKLRDAFIQDGWCGNDIVNVDFSSEAVRRGQAIEQQQTPEKAMHWRCADLLHWKSVSQLSDLAPFQVILDKSTSDAIATADDRHFGPTGDSAHVCPAVQEILNQNSAVALSPVELLALHLVPLTAEGTTWITLSYSTFRFDRISYISRYWKVRSRTALKAPSGPVSSSAYTPDVYHWIYILDRI